MKRFILTLAGVLLVVLLLALCIAAVRAVRSLAPRPEPTPPVVHLDTRPRQEAERSGLGPAPVSGTTHLHTPFSKGNCGACHAVAGGGDPLRLQETLWGDEIEVCLSCHGTELAGDQMRAQQHEPFADGECTACHDPHASDIATLLRADQPDLCVTCHEQDGITHAPHITSGPDNCLTCHIPHSAPESALLPKPITSFCRDCHKTVVKDPLAEKGHDQVAMKEECVTCHDVHQGTVDDVARGERCRECHGADIGLNTGTVEHANVSKGTCLQCHVFHNEPGLLAIRQGDSVLRQKPPQACLTCHPDVREAMRQPVVHGPLANPETPGVCDACHATHVASVPALLLEPQPELCTACHGKLRPHVPQPTTDKGKRADTVCDTCHLPHGGAQDHLLNGPPTATCSTCHDDVTTAFAKDPHSGAVAGKCLGCHIVHRGKESSLREPTSTLCGQCHEDVVAKIDDTPHGRLENGCAACHSHRGSTLKPTDADRGCTACHGNLAHGTHPVRADQGARDPWHGGPLTCVSCHGAHGTGFPGQVRLSGDALCLKCHKMEGR